MTMDKPRSKKANALHQNVKNYAYALDPFSEGDVITWEKDGTKYCAMHTCGDWLIMRSPNEKARPPRTQSNTALYAGLRHPGVLDIRFHSFSDGEVIG